VENWYVRVLLYELVAINYVCIPCWDHSKNKKYTNTCGDSYVILLTIVTAAMLEELLVAAV